MEFQTFNLLLSSHWMTIYLLDTFRAGQEWLYPDETGSFFFHWVINPLLDAGNAVKNWVDPPVEPYLWSFMQFLGNVLLNVANHCLVKPMQYLWKTLVSWGYRVVGYCLYMAGGISYVEYREIFFGDHCWTIPLVEYDLCISASTWETLEYLVECSYTIGFGCIAVFFLCIASGIFYATAKEIAKLTLVRFPRYLLGVVLGWFYLKNPTWRKKFRDTEWVESPPVKGKSHPKCAAERDSARNFAEAFARRIGYHVYSFQRRNSEQGGLRAPYDGKDIAPTSSYKRVQKHDLIYMGDTDYYVDESDFSYPNPYILYTIIPEDPAFIGKEYSFNFLTATKIQMFVNEGKRYEHELWDWCGDHIKVTGSSLFSRTVVHEITRMKVSPNRYLVFLNPIATIPWYLSWTTRFLTFENLQRVNVGDGKYARISVGGQYVSTSTKGKIAASSYRVPCALWSVCMSAEERMGFGPSKVMTLEQTLLKTNKFENGAATIIASSVEEQLHEDSTIHSRIPLEHTVRHYAPGSIPAFDWKLVLHSLCHPFVHNSFAPIDCLKQAVNGVRKRLTDISNPENPVPPSKLPRYRELHQEYCEHLIPENLRHTGVPKDDQEVYDRQKRPSQRRILFAAWNFGIDWSLPIDQIQRIWKLACKCFMKAEAYPSVNDARNIHTVPGEVKAEQSPYEYAMSEVFKTQTWYGFGEPSAIEQKLGDVLHTSTALLSNDYSRMDGRQSLMDVEFDICERQLFFRREYHDAVQKHIAVLYGTPSYFSCGWRKLFSFGFDNVFARRSGSIRTSNANTSKSAREAYFALRLTKKPDGEFFTPKEAWNLLGLYAGDDGLTTKRGLLEHVWQDFSSNMVTVVGDFGGSLTVDEFQRGEAFTFLSRWWSPNSWHGEVSSVACPKRAIGKMTVVPYPIEAGDAHKTEVARAKMFLRKLDSYLQNSAGCIFGQMLSSVFYRFNHLISDREPLHYWDTFATRFRSEAQDYVMEKFEEELPGFDWRRFNSWKNASIRQAKQDNSIFTLLEILATVPTCWTEEVYKKPGFAERNKIDVDSKGRKRDADMCDGEAVAEDPTTDFPRMIGRYLWDTSGSKIPSIVERQSELESLNLPLPPKNETPDPANSENSDPPATPPSPPEQKHPHPSPPEENTSPAQATDPPPTRTPPSGTQPTPSPREEKGADKPPGEKRRKKNAGKKQREKERRRKTEVGEKEKGEEKKPKASKGDPGKGKN